MRAVFALVPSPDRESEDILSRYEAKRSTGRIKSSAMSVERTAMIEWWFSLEQD
jgi:hypothetical protein